MSNFRKAGQMNGISEFRKKFKLLKYKNIINSFWARDAEIFEIRNFMNAFINIL